jgi:hypothetical protein
MITLTNESMQHFLPNNSPRKVILSAVHHVQHGDETRNEVEVQIREEPQISRDIDEGVSFDTDFDDNVSLNSIHSSSLKFNFSPTVEDMKIIGLLDAYDPTTPTASNTKNWNYHYCDIRDQFLLSATGADKERFSRAISFLPEEVLSLAAAGFMHGSKKK